jgi:hypothetical protein
VELANGDSTSPREFWGNVIDLIANPQRGDDFSLGTNFAKQRETKNNPGPKQVAAMRRGAP